MKMILVCQKNHGEKKHYKTNTSTRYLNNISGLSVIVFMCLILVQIAKSCLEYMHAGRRYSGNYNIFDLKGFSYPVYCDLTSEPKAAWTLLMSGRTPSAAGTGFFSSVPLVVDKPSYKRAQSKLECFQTIALPHEAIAFPFIALENYMQLSEWWARSSGLRSC